MKSILISLFTLAMFTAHAQTPVIVKQKGVKAVAIYKDSTRTDIWLQGYAKVDTTALGFITTRWYQVSGPRVTLATPRAFGTKARRIGKGSYRFGFIVIDSKHNLRDTAYSNINVN